jgi:hypothetical protein
VPLAAFTWWTNHFGNDVVVYTKPDAGLTPDQVATVVQSVGKTIFAPFRIDVTATKPVSAPYSTIYIGGNRSQLGQPYQHNLETGCLVVFCFPVNYLGIAEHIDLGNADKGDFATVFSGLADFGTPGTPAFLQNLTLAVAHEAGHILGLQHVVPAGELMNSAFSTFRPGLLTNADLPIYIGLIEGPTGCQNSYQQLGRNVGFVEGVPTAETPCEILGQISGMRNAGSAGLYGATLAVYYDGDIGPSLYDLGDLPPSSPSDFQASVGSGPMFALYGSSIPGGPIDTISSPLGLQVLNQYSSLNDLTAGALLTRPDRSGSVSFNLFQLTPGAGFREFGSASLRFQSGFDDVPPTTIATSSPVPDATGWNNTTVTVNLNATDNPGGSGVKQIKFATTGAQTTFGIVHDSSASIVITAEGTTTIQFSATDNAGNTESPTSLTVRINKTLPGP